MKDDPISHKNAIQISTNVTHDIGFTSKHQVTLYPMVAWDGWGWVSTNGFHTNKDI